MPSPAPTPFPPPHQSSYPALYLFPLNDSFIPKNISLVNGQRVKIGRQTNAKTVPGERNGYFDSKVLSRQHAEVWEEGGKIYIKDVKSSNGTFINGERLSPEGVESEQFELKTDDIVVRHNLNLHSSMASHFFPNMSSPCSLHGLNYPRVNLFMCLCAAVTSTTVDVGGGKRPCGKN